MSTTSRPHFSFSSSSTLSFPPNERTCKLLNMAYPNPNPPKAPSLYPEVIQSNHEAPKPNPSSSSSKLYPTIDYHDLVENLFPDNIDHHSQNEDLYSPSAPPEGIEEVLIRIPGAIVHLIDRSYSVQLACGDLSVVRLIQGNNVVVVLIRVADEVQWPLTTDEAAVKIDESHYFFSLRIPKDHESGSDSSDDDDYGKSNKTKKKKKKKEKSQKKKSDCEILNYGVTIASKGQEGLLKGLDLILQSYSCFSVQKVSEKADELDGLVSKEMTPEDLESKQKKEIMEGKCAAYWTTLAPNVEDYSGVAAKLIAAGSGQLIKGILWCGDVTMERLKWGNDVLKKRMSPVDNAEVDPDTLKRIKRVKRITKMTEKMANGVLSGVVKVSGFFTGSVANSTVGKKFFGLLPGEIVLASLDGFNKVCDAVEVAGRNVMSTSSTVTTELVSHRYGEKAAEATNQGLDAAGHAIGTAWAAFKIRKALNPKSVIKPSSISKSAAKAAAKEYKAKAKGSNK